MLPKIIIGIVLVVLGIMAFGLVSKGGFGEPPAGFPGSKTQTEKQPPCPEPLILQTPVDLSKVTSILYPGQERGGNFKPHGGFRFDNSKSGKVEVKAPLDGTLREAQAYTENGEVQYLMDFVHPCGIVYRFDHLAEFSPKFEEFAKSLEVLSEEEWKSDAVHQKDLSNLNISVKQGELIATSVGFKNSGNTFVDLGVYDLRGKSLYQNPRPFAVCWFDLLSASDSAKVKSLPSGDSKSSTQSTLCK